MQGNRQRDAKAQLQVITGGDVGCDPFREVMQADTEGQQDRGTLDVTGQRGGAFLH